MPVFYLCWLYSFVLSFHCVWRFNFVFNLFKEICTIWLLPKKYLHRLKVLRYFHELPVTSWVANVLNILIRVLLTTFTDRAIQTEEIWHVKKISCYVFWKSFNFNLYLVVQVLFWIAHSNKLLNLLLLFNKPFIINKLFIILNTSINWFLRRLFSRESKLSSQVFPRTIYWHAQELT